MRYPCDLRGYYFSRQIYVYEYVGFQGAENLGEIRVLGLLYPALLPLVRWCSDNGRLLCVGAPRVPVLIIVLTSRVGHRSPRVV